jgi:hypothetical protein
MSEHETAIRAIEAERDAALRERAESATATVERMEDAERDADDAWARVAELERALREAQPMVMHSHEPGSLALDSRIEWLLAKDVALSRLDGEPTQDTES